MARIKEYSLTYLVRPHIVHTTSYGGERQERAHVIVSLTDEDGLVGYGEATPLSNFTGETTRVVYTVLEDMLLPAVIGFDSCDIAALHRKMNRLIYGNHAAKCAIDCAVYDLMAKELNVPLYKLLGGKSRERVAINRHVGIMSPEKSVETAREFVEQGYGSIKMKVGTDVDAAVERVQAVRAAVGPGVKMRVDANNNLTYVQACDFIERTMDCSLEFYEQLMPKWDFEGACRLKTRYPVRFLQDEAINSVQDAAKYALSGAVDAFTIKPCKCGGLYPALQIAATADAFGLSIVVASTYDTHIGCSACLHLAAALPNVSTASDLSTLATQPDWAKTGHRREGMFLYPGDQPGIGVLSMLDYPMV